MEKNNQEKIIIPESHFHSRRTPEKEETVEVTQRRSQTQGCNNVGGGLTVPESSQSLTSRQHHNHSNLSLSSANSCTTTGSRVSLGSIEDQRSVSRSKAVGKWHQAVKLGMGTKNLLNKFKKSSVTFDEGENENEQNKIQPPTENIKKSSWSEHVWSTFIHRGYSDDVTEKSTIVAGKELLTDFQQDKFKYFFYHVLDLNADHVISEEDFTKLNQRIKHYMDWSVNTVQFLALKEVHDLFLDFFLKTCANIKLKNDGEWAPFLQSPTEPTEKSCVTIEEWLDVWGLLVGEAKKINDLPIWLQYYPKTLFDTINRSGSGVISKHELKLFFTAFLDLGRLGEDKVKQVTEESYRAMTSNGDVQLDFHIYKLSFLNFLLGKQPNGPGQYIFGTILPGCGNKLFSVDYSVLTRVESDTHRETFSVEKLTIVGDRKSIIV